MAHLSFSMNLAISSLKLTQVSFHIPTHSLITSMITNLEFPLEGNDFTFDNQERLIFDLFSNMVLSKFAKSIRTSSSTNLCDIAMPSIRPSTITTILGRSTLALCDTLSAIRHIVNLTTPLENAHQDAQLLRVQRISIAIANVCDNFSIRGVILFILSITVELEFSITQLISSLVDMFKGIPHVSTQLIQTIGGFISNIFVGDIEAAEPSIDLDGLYNKMSEPEVITSLCSILGGLAALIAASLVGCANYKPNRSFLENIANFGKQVSQLKSGVYSLLSLVTDFTNLVREAVLSYFGQSVHRSVVAAIESLHIPYEDGTLSASTFFEIAARLNTQEGEQEMSVNIEELKRGKLILHVISRLTTKNMQDQMRISAPTVTHLRQLARELEERVRTASVKTQTERYRFTPYSIWLYGEPGVGKSVAMNLMCSTLLASLEKEDAAKYEIPRKEQQIFSCTFSQEFHTGYNDHYLVKFDDMCQDKPGSNRVSSTLQFIQWVSCVPVNVNQAALTDKKCPFSSKVMVCTSNEGWPNRTKEIQDNLAFLRRRNLLIECVKSNDLDPILQHPIAFYKRDALDENVTPKKYNSFLEVMKEINIGYRKHFEHQKSLASTQDDDKINSLVDLLNESARPSLLPQADEEPHSRAIARAYAPLDGLGLGIVQFRYTNGSYRALPYSADREDHDAEYEQDELEQMLQEWPDIQEFEWTVYPDWYLELLVIVSEEEEVAQPSMKLTETVKRYYSVGQDTLTEFMDKCYTESLKLKDWMAQIMEKPKWIVVALIGTAAVGLTGLFAHKKYQTFYERASCSYDKNIIRTKPKPQMPIVAKPSMDAFSETLLKKNLVVIQHDKGRMNGVFVKERWMLTCRHFFDTYLPESRLFTIDVLGNTVTQCYDPKRRIDLQGVQDLCLYLCDLAVPQFRDITSLFQKGGAIVPEYFNGAILSKSPYVGMVTLPFQTSTKPVIFDNGTQCTLVRYFKGVGYHMKGISGSPMLVSEHTGRSPSILGIQMAVLERSNACLVEPVTQEMLATAFESATPSVLQLNDDFDEEFFDCPEEFWQEVKDVVHFVDTTERLHMSNKTSLRRSEIFDCFEIDETLKQYAPAALSGKSPGVAPEYHNSDPMLLSMKGFGLKFGAFDCRVGATVLESFIEEDKIVRRSPNIKMRLLSNKEMLDGIPGIYKGVEINTSPGLPYVKQRKLGGKKDFISFNDDNERVMKPEIWNDIERLENQAKHGQIPQDLLSYACLKDELRPVERVAQCKTRTFIVLPMHYNLLLRKYFGTWVAVQHLKAGEISSCVGIDPNTQWDILYDRLTAVGEDMEDFDYSDWDRTLHAQWFHIYADRVSASYGDKPGSDGFKVRRMLMEYLVHMKIQIKDFIILTHGGNKSGCAITAEINSDVHDMLMYYVWLQICNNTKRYAMQSIAEFRANCATIVYGDDIVKSTAPGIVDWFNGANIKIEVEKLGMSITPASKTDTEFRVKRIEDVTFLKRAFVRLPEDNGLVRAPLDKSVIQRMILWIHKSDDPVTATKANIEGALREAFYWGELYYDELKRKCFTACGVRFAGAGYPVLPSVASYEVMEQCFRERRADWTPVLFQAVPLSVNVESEDVRF